MIVFYSLRLRIWLPVFVALAFGGLFVALLLSEYGARRNLLIEDGQRLVEQDMALLQREMNREFARGLTVDAHRALWARGKNLRYLRLAALDEQGRVMFATGFPDVASGTRLQLAATQQASLQRARRQGQPVVVWVPDQNRIAAFFPLRLPPAADRKSSASLTGSIPIGILYAGYDLDRDMKQVWPRVWRSSWPTWLLLLATMLLLIGFLNFFVTRPVEHLSSAARALAAGQHDVRTSIRGAGELFGLGQVFNEMSAELEGRSRERERAEQALQAKNEELELSARKLHQVVETAFDGLAVVDRHGIIQMVNSRLSQLTGYTRHELIGQSVELLVPERFADHAQLREGYSADPRPRQMAASKELYARRKDGSEFSVIISLNPIQTDEGPLIAAVIADVSELRATEARRIALIAELERKNRELEHYTYSVSHDLKSPLVTIAGFAAFMKTDVLAGRMDRLANHTDRIEQAASRMRELLDSLLELSRIGGGAVNRTPTPAGPIITEVLAQLGTALEAGGFELDVAANLPDLPMDALRLQAVFSNLIGNAVKYAGTSAKPRIEIGFRQADDGSSVWFVRDNGPGIEPQFHQQVFGLFQRLDATQEGTGIGLAIVERAVGMYGGRAWVESLGAGGGSTFCFSLPAAGAGSK